MTLLRWFCKNATCNFEISTIPSLLLSIFVFFHALLFLNSSILYIKSKRIALSVPGIFQRLSWSSRFSKAPPRLFHLQSLLNIFLPHASHSLSAYIVVFYLIFRVFWLDIRRLKLLRLASSILPFSPIYLAVLQHHLKAVPLPFPNFISLLVDYFLCHCQQCSSVC